MEEGNALRLAVPALLGLDDATIDDEQSKLYFDEDKFEQVYFVRGGRIENSASIT